VSASPLVSLRGIEKRFPGVLALDGIDLDFDAGEVHAIVGQNGAGKSTLIRILTGVHPPDSGEIRIDGAHVRFADPRQALRAGIAAIHQESTRIPEMSVAENLLLAREPRGVFGIDRKAMRTRAHAALARVGLDIDLDRALGSYPPAVQQRVAIARALDMAARVLVLDEPTASLDRREAEVLLRSARDLAARGLLILFVGHRLDEIFAVSDRITVLKNGKKIGTFERSETTRLAIVEGMLGRALDDHVASRPARTGTGAPVLEARGVAGPGLDAPFDVHLAAGEVLGLAGLLGSGRSELLRLLAGVERRREGEVRVEGAAVPSGDVRAAVDLGLVLSPEERQSEGIFPSLSVRENVAIALDRALRPRSTARQRSVAAEMARRLSIVCSDLEQSAGSLSGGNQQKVLLGRWLAVRPKVLLLDEPTRGVDVGAKAEIQGVVRDLAGQGMAALFVSSALEEVLATSDRALSLHGRRVVSEHRGQDLCEESLLRAIAGGGEVLP
jgi:simple sugar transport system ATP-binding protein